MFTGPLRYILALEGLWGPIVIALLVAVQRPYYLSEKWRLTLPVARLIPFVRQPKPPLAREPLYSGVLP
jgi:hypothetical protein